MMLVVTGGRGRRLLEKSIIGVADGNDRADDLLTLVDCEPGVKHVVSDGQSLDDAQHRISFARVRGVSRLTLPDPGRSEEMTAGGFKVGVAFWVGQHGRERQVFNDRRIMHSAVEAIIKVLELGIVSNSWNPLAADRLLSAPISGLGKVRPDLRVDARLAEGAEGRKLGGGEVEPRVIERWRVVGRRAARHRSNAKEYQRVA